jgi:prophage regulatory protein
MTTSIIAPPLHVLRIKDVKQRTGLCTSAIYQLKLAGKFPKPIRLGGNSVGWLEHEVDAWIEARVAERDQPRTHPLQEVAKRRWAR